MNATSLTETLQKRTLSKTAWSEKGFRIKRGAEPYYRRTHRVYSRDGFGVHVVTYDVYDFASVEPKRKLEEILAKKIDLLAAIFTVNRSAKRYRDAASSFYLKGLHGFAKNSKSIKEYLYLLKDRGIAKAFNDELIRPVALHSNFTLYHGNGYYFHSLVNHSNENLPETSKDEYLFVDAKPKDWKEPRLKDAVYTLEHLKN